jgi:hypothetical protein
MTLCTRNDFRCSKNRDSKPPAPFGLTRQRDGGETPRVGIEAWNLLTHVIGMILRRTESERDVRPVVGEPEIDQEALAESQSDT